MVGIWKKILNILCNILCLFYELIMVITIIALAIVISQSSHKFAYKKAFREEMQNIKKYKRQSPMKGYYEWQKDQNEN